MGNGIYRGVCVTTPNVSYIAYPNFGPSKLTFDWLFVSCFIHCPIKVLGLLPLFNLDPSVSCTWLQERPWEWGNCISRSQSYWWRNYSCTLLVCHSKMHLYQKRMDFRITYSHLQIFRTKLIYMEGGWTYSDQKQIFLHRRVTTFLPMVLQGRQAELRYKKLAKASHDLHWRANWRGCLYIKQKFHVTIKGNKAWEETCPFGIRGEPWG